ncbi:MULTISPECIES: class I SAM-dependent methyltransferase [unclassified Ochrobactrum]|uniref:class I SAM-dependent methyltransferase n=1 Tax=unclassified Ochrobactrum TaxID=239106 RepID=UPI000DEEF885|nr:MULTISPECIES: class I SAM-dependent methyltransferase [unclassified Ochrobactrum]MBQ0708299.1 class I SAM-dependent methyltransferase [Ochrobactrum sp. AP1BH01-1]
MQGNTLGFYNSNATDYAAGGDLPNPKLFDFLKRCKPGGRILELGTGSGTDARAILDAGFQLDATDGSTELAAIASRRLGQHVRTMMFDELSTVEEYDGIYACASLTHVPRSELGPVVERVHSALAKGGIVWASFKTGTAEGYDALGRYYNYLSANELREYWTNNGHWSHIEIECWTGGAYDKRPTDWAAIAAVR